MAKQIYIDSNGNEIPVSGTITNDNNLPHYTGTPTAGTTAEAIASSKTKSVLLTGTITSNYADGSTIGYRSTGNGVDITSLTGYPTGKNILGYSIESAVIGTGIALLRISGNYIIANSKTSGDVNFAIRCYYTEA